MSDLETAEVLEPAGAVREPTVEGLPGGYHYGVTRYADVILRESLPSHFDDLVAALEGFEPQLAELQAGGGNRTPFVSRFDESLAERGWGKRSIQIGKTIDGRAIFDVRGHEIDMLGEASANEPYPGVAVEMEWSNKDPFFDRDLLNFQALHREGVLAVGVVVTRGPRLQALIKPVILNPKGGEKYGESTTHWNKLVPRVNLGGGGECPLLLIGIEPERIQGVAIAEAVANDIQDARARFDNWREHFPSQNEARAAFDEARRAALARLPEVP
jgi:hypothetical protein